MSGKVPNKNCCKAEATPPLSIFVRSWRGRNRNRRNLRDSNGGERICLSSRKLYRDANCALCTCVRALVFEFTSQSSARSRIDFRVIFL